MKRYLRKIRSYFYTKLVKRKAKSFGNSLRVNNRSGVTKNTILGDHVNFNGMVILGGGTVKIGNYFHSGSGCQMITSFHNYDTGTEIPYDSTYIHKDITIEDFVWLGNRVILLGGITIGEGAIIQAGSVVVSDVPPMAIAGGSPARVFKTRDVEHFNQLKKEGKFH